MSNEMYEKGLKIRREVLGSEYVDRAIDGADDFNRDFQNLLTEYCWGAVWGRPGFRAVLGYCVCLASQRPPVGPAGRASGVARRGLGA